MKSTPTLIACIAITLGFSACTKDFDPTPTQQQQQGCKLLKQYLYDNGAKSDSLEYSYTGNNITKITDRNDSSYNTLEYNNSNKVVKQNFFEGLNATRPYAYLTVTYNADGSIAKLEAYEVMGNTNTLSANLVYSYSAGKLTSEVVNSIDNGVSSKAEEHQYSWTGNNITKDVLTTYYLGTPDVETITYTFDTKENYFKKGGTNQIFTGATGSDFGIPALPLVLNANNVVGVQYGAIPFTLEYTVDNKSNVTGIKALGEQVFSFLYACP